MGFPIFSAFHKWVEEITLETSLLLKRDVQETALLAPGRSAFQQNTSELTTEEKRSFPQLQRAQGSLVCPQTSWLYYPEEL